MSEPIERLLEKPAPKQAVILARGPSLLKYDQARHHDACVFAVNIVGFSPDYRCDYAVMLGCNQRKGMEPVGIPIRPDDFKDAFDGRGYYFTTTRERQKERDAMGRVGSAAIMIPWRWGCRDIWIYGMDSWPDGKDIRHVVDDGPISEICYLRSCQRQHNMIADFGMEGFLHWAHLQ